MPGYERNTTATVIVFAFDQATNKGKTGDAANLSIYYKKKGGTLTVLTDTTFTELSATNAPGYYEVDLGIAEIDAQYTHFFPKSSTAVIGVVVVSPHFTVPVNSYLGTNELVIGTNNDKSGYLISGTKTTLDSLNDLSSTALASEIDSVQSDIADLSASLLGFATFGTIDDGAPAAGGFTVSSDFTNSDDHYNNLKCYILTGNQKGRRATITDQSGLTLTLGSGLTAAPENGADIAIMS